MGLLLLPLALIAYFVGIFISFVATLNRSQRTQGTVAWIFTLGGLLHLAAIARHALQVGRFPIGNMAEYLMVLGWAVMTFYLVVWFRSHVQAAALVLPPLATVMAVGAVVLPAKDVRLPFEHQQGWFIFHTGVATLGMAALCVSFAMSLIYLLQERAIKTKKARRFFDLLPSLETCDRIGYHAVLWGFPLFTLGIATGTVWSATVYHTFWMGGAKQTFPMLAWVVFAALLYARLVRGFRGRKSAYVTIAGFTLGLLTILGMTI